MEHSLELDTPPIGWESKSFDDICKKISNSYQPTPDGNMIYLGLEHLEKGFPSLIGKGLESEVKSNKSAFKNGDVLFGKLRPYLRKSVLVDFDGVCSTDILVFRNKENTINKYLKYLVHTDQFIEHAKSTTTGVQHPRTSWSSLKAFKLCLPTKAEQKKIAAVLSTIQQAIELQDSLINTTQELKKALMQKLFTEGLRGEPQKETEIGLVPASWVEKHVDDVAIIKGGKRLPKGEKFAESVTKHPYIRVTDFKDFGVDANDLRYISDDIHKKIHRYIIRKNEIYISIAGTIGLTGTITDDLDGANLTENAARLIVKDTHSLEPRFLMYFLGSENSQAEIKAQTMKNAQPKLALMRIQQLHFFQPKIDEQYQIIFTLDSLQEKIEFHRNKKQLLTELFNSLLHKLMTAEIRVNELDLSELKQPLEA